MESTPVDPRLLLTAAFNWRCYGDANGFSRLSRCERTLQRILVQTLDSLWQLQRRRAAVEDTPSWHDAA